jgi:hypothetical protein
MNTAPAPRLHVLFARDANSALVIRRGPSKWFHLISWDTQHDVFESGAWIHGRIYEEKCALSPNGELLVYAVHKGSQLRTAYTDCWTGVSRPPWVFALALWPFGTTYGGGGWFTGNRALTVCGYGWDGIEPHPDHRPQGLTVSFVPYNATRPSSSTAQSMPEKPWSGFDQNGRVVWAEDGKLFATKSSGRPARLLADFNNMSPSPTPAPDRARRPIAKLKK